MLIMKVRLSEELIRQGKTADDYAYDIHMALVGANGINDRIAVTDPDDKGSFYITIRDNKQKRMNLNMEII